MGTTGPQPLCHSRLDQSSRAASSQGHTLPAPQDFAGGDVQQLQCLS